MVASVGINFDFEDEISDSAGNSYVSASSVADSTCKLPGSVYFF